MISFLSRLFIKDRTNYNDSTVRKKYGTLTGITGIFLNICLFAGKFIAGIVTGRRIERAKRHLSAGSRQQFA